jgi:hypothetical protein
LLALVAPVSLALLALAALLALITVAPLLAAAVMTAAAVPPSVVPAARQRHLRRRQSERHDYEQCGALARHVNRQFSLLRAVPEWFCSTGTQAGKKTCSFFS